MFKTQGASGRSSIHQGHKLGDEGLSVHPSIRPSHSNPSNPSQIHNIIKESDIPTRSVSSPALRPRHPGLPTTSFDSISVSCPGSCCVAFGPGSLSRSRLTAHGSRLTVQGTQIDAHHPRITHHASRLTLDPFLSSLYRFRFCFWPCSSFVLILTPPLPLSLPPSQPLPHNQLTFSPKIDRPFPSPSSSPSPFICSVLSLSRSVSLRPFRPDRGLRRIPSFLRPKEEQTANRPNRPVSTR